MTNFEWMQSLSKEETSIFLHGIAISFTLRDYENNFDPHFIINGAYLRNEIDILNWLNDEHCDDEGDESCCILF